MVSFKKVTIRIETSKGFGTQAEVAFRTSNLNLMIFGTRSSRAARAMARSRTTTTINDHRESTPIATVAKNGEHIRLIG